MKECKLLPNVIWNLLQDYLTETEVSLQSLLDDAKFRDPQAINRATHMFSNASKRFGFRDFADRKWAYFRVNKPCGQQVSVRFFALNLNLKEEVYDCIEYRIYDRTRKHGPKAHFFLGTYSTIQLLLQNESSVP